MSMVKCPCCGQDTPAAMGPIERDIDGVPFALSIRDGLGVPVVSVTQANYHVSLDGKRVEHCVAFDRKQGRVWVYSARIVNEEFVVTMHDGMVTVEPGE